MGLPKVFNTQKAYKALMLTFGPIDPADPKAMRERVAGMCSQYFGQDLKDIRMAFEPGEDGVVPYNHCHLIVGFNKPRKPSMMLVKRLKTLCHEDERGRKPNLGMNYVPQGDRECSKIGAYGVLLNYLTNPVKKKMTDEGALEHQPVKTVVAPPRPLATRGPELFLWRLTWELLPQLAAARRKWELK